MHLNRLPVFARLKYFLGRSDVTGPSMLGVHATVKDIVRTSCACKPHEDYIILTEQQVHGVSLPSSLVVVEWNRKGKLCSWHIIELAITPPVKKSQKRHYRFCVNHSYMSPELPTQPARYDHSTLEWFIRVSKYLSDLERHAIIDKLRALVNSAT